MTIDDESEGPSPAPDKANRKKLKEKIELLKMEKRSGKFTSNPDRPGWGIFKAPRSEQKEYRKGLRQQIKEVRKQL